MTHSDPKAVVQAAQGQKESSPQVCREDMNRPQLSNHPETPTSPLGVSNSTPIPEPVTLLGQHQTALCRIQTLETHNAKLYEDNSRLVNAVNMLNDRLTFVGASKKTQVLCLAHVQEKLRSSEVNHALINQKYQELLQCIPAGSAQYHISVELQSLRDAYASLDQEYRLLRDKYVKLKALADSNCMVQQQARVIGECTFLLSEILTLRGPDLASASRTTQDLTPVTRSEFRPYTQGQNSSISPTSFAPSGSFPPFPDQGGDHRQRSSENIIIKSSLRPDTTSIATTCSEPLPTPPLSASLPGAQISPTSFPVHAPVLARSLPLLHHAQISEDPHTLSGPSDVTSSRCIVGQGASERLKADIHFHQCSGEATDIVHNKSAPCDQQILVSASSESSARPLKRSNTELRSSTSLGGEHNFKKPRTEGEAERPVNINADADKTQSLPASADPHSDHKLSLSDSDIRSYERCVDLIFEKDADVENGVFCGLCYDRYDAKMIPQLPDVLIQPDFDFLVRHCMTMHPTVWEDLLRKA